MNIKNIVFDVGNVLVRWEPYEVINAVFPENDPLVFYKLIRPIWLDLNLGKITEDQAIDLYHSLFNIPKNKLIQFMHQLKVSQTPIPGSLELLDTLSQAQYSLFSITDNVKELIAYHQQHSNFLHKFHGIIVSAEVGVLKPNPEIYYCLIQRYSLNPAETVFIDDLIENVEGAKKVGMHAFQFLDAQSCRAKLNDFGVHTS